MSHKYFFKYNFQHKQEDPKIYLEKFEFGPYFKLYIEGSQTLEASPVTLYPRGREASYTPLHRMLARIYENDSRWFGPKLFIGEELITNGKVKEQILFSIDDPVLTELYQPKTSYRAYVWEFNK